MCSIFLLTYKWPNGWARLKTTTDLATSLYEVVVKTPAGEEDKVYSSHVKIPQPNEDRETPTERCLDGFFAHLLPGINWGLMAVVIAPKDLQKCCQNLYYKRLPLIGVTRNI